MQFSVLCRHTSTEQFDSPCQCGGMESWCSPLPNVPLCISGLVIRLCEDVAASWVPTVAAAANAASATLRRQSFGCGCGADNKVFIILFAFRTMVLWDGLADLACFLLECDCRSYSELSIHVPRQCNICSDSELPVNPPRQRARTTVLSRCSPLKLFLPVCSCKCQPPQRGSFKAFQSGCFSRCPVACWLLSFWVWVWSLLVVLVLALALSSFFPEGSEP